MITRLRLEGTHDTQTECQAELLSAARKLQRDMGTQPSNWKITQNVVVLNERTGKHDGRIVMKLQVA